MNTLMPAPVAKPQIGKQAVAARLRAGTPLSSSRVHACESSLAGLPGLYSGRFLFCKQHDLEARQASAFRPGKDRAQPVRASTLAEGASALASGIRIPALQRGEQSK